MIGTCNSVQKWTFPGLAKISVGRSCKFVNYFRLQNHKVWEPLPYPIINFSQLRITVFWSIIWITWPSWCQIIHYWFDTMSTVSIVLYKEKVNFCTSVTLHSCEISMICTVILHLRLDLSDHFFSPEVSQLILSALHISRTFATYVRPRSYMIYKSMARSMTRSTHNGISPSSYYAFLGVLIFSQHFE